VYALHDPTILNVAYDLQLEKPSPTQISNSPTPRVRLSQGAAILSKLLTKNSLIIYDHLVLTIQRYVTLAWKDPQNIVEEINKLK